MTDMIEKMRSAYQTELAKPPAIGAGDRASALKVACLRKTPSTHQGKSTKP